MPLSVVDVNNSVNQSVDVDVYLYRLECIFFYKKIILFSLYVV